jgi:alkaline phosphatase
MRNWIFAWMAAPLAAAASNVIFIHPDGAGISHWQAARFYWAGPDGDLNWDRIPEVAVYRGHMSDSLSASSNGGGTTHAYGIKVPIAAFGTDGKTDARPMSAGGWEGSIMHEAMRSGVRTGLVNSGSIVEPGTACFVASVEKRQDSAEIAKQVVESGVDVILGGGEEWLLPEGVEGRFGKGKRGDGLNLVEKAAALGYKIVHTREELWALPDDTGKVLGIFAAEDTFNDIPEREMRETKTPAYAPGAPTIAEMVAAALRFLSPGPFLLVAEEEGNDNFGNLNNAWGALEALKRADDAYGTALDFVEKHPDTLLVTAADSSAGAMDVWGFPRGDAKAVIAVAAGKDLNGAPFSLSPEGGPFFSKPDRNGNELPFVITWGTVNDTSGGILVRAAGRHSEKVRGSFDNTKIYELMRSALFGEPGGGRD